MALDYHYEIMNQINENKYGIALPQRIEKTWGYEDIIINTDLYCMKILSINKNQFSSIHFHVEKHETLLVTSGLLRIHVYNKFDNSSYDLKPGQAFVITPGIVHILWALEDTQLIEASTFSKDTDSYRIIMPND